MRIPTWGRRSIVLAALFFFACQFISSAKEAPATARRLIAKRTYGAYAAAIFKKETTWSIEIKKSQRIIYEDHEFDGHYSFGRHYEGDTPFIHVTGQKLPNIVFLKTTGEGAHCCFILRIFELEPVFKQIAEFNGGSTPPELKDINHDGIPDILFTDDCFGYTFSSFGGRATGSIYLKYSNHAYVFDEGHTRKSPPDLRSFDKEFPSWEIDLRELEGAEQDFPPQSLIQATTNLVYSGNSKMAFALLDRFWPRDVEGKDEFVKKYKETIRTCDYYPELRKMGLDW